LLAWAAPFGEDRRWAIESADGLGKFLAQQLLAAGEHVVDVPPLLSARVRLLGTGAPEDRRRENHRFFEPLCRARWTPSYTVRPLGMTVSSGPG
jgi:hypothetical protein